MKLQSINSLLRIFGLVLCVSVDVDGDEPTRLWIELASTYDKRIE